MKTILPIYALAFLALCGVHVCAAGEEAANPESMNEKALVARARLLTQEELEISRRAAQQAGSEKVRDFAKRAAARAETLDKKLTDLAKAAGVEEPP